VWRYTRIGLLPPPVKVGWLTRWKGSAIRAHKFTTRPTGAAVVVVVAE
jgi:predicted DNA-binding transcriptional regulator AlpA